MLLWIILNVRLRMYYAYNKLVSDEVYGCNNHKTSSD